MKRNNYLFSSESVSEGHPDKVADQISDAILDECLKYDPASHVACETFVSTGFVLVGGEITTKAYVDVPEVARRTIREIGYTKGEYGFDYNSCGVVSLIHAQSPDINQGVSRKDPSEQGAGDQGMMFGYACNETEEYMPLPVSLARKAMDILTEVRKKSSLMPYLRPDSKCQFTVEYDGTTNRPVRVDTIVLSTQHDDFDADEKAMHDKIENDVKSIVIERLVGSLPEKTRELFGDGIRILVNPTGKFVIGGPAGDTGLTGRKIIVDTYGGRAPHGGGSFSGKDPSKVDRSATYAARHIAKNMVAAGVADEMTLQLAYAIGVARPVSIFVTTNGTNHTKFSDAEIANYIWDNPETFPLTPSGIIGKYGLCNPIYLQTARYGHFGCTPYSERMVIGRKRPAEMQTVRFYSWEELDTADRIREDLL
ncbi:MAG: methionine adenosyltransferase [Bacteroidales bacterium]|nr:methionine adenosyltransferase [Bacteroidales bacterium]MCI2121739.1 methionine adenosyltransferase [Bacteroidales bacterium]MCI2145093.1 methionine adenosyltransferase [Bacteroidales bacterium]